MMLEMTVGLLAKAPVHSCTVCCKIWRMVAVLGPGCTDGEDDKMLASALSAGACSVAASRDSGAG